MEDQLKYLDARTTAIEQFLPTLAIKDDLRLTTDALHHQMAKLATRDELNAGLEDAKRYTLLLIQATRRTAAIYARFVLTRSFIERRAAIPSGTPTIPVCRASCD